MKGAKFMGRAYFYIIILLFSPAPSSSFVPLRYKFTYLLYIKALSFSLSHPSHTWRLLVVVVVLSL
jgi:hypothetical protein